MSLVARWVRTWCPGRSLTLQQRVRRLRIVKIEGIEGIGLARCPCRPSLPLQKSRVWRAGARWSDHRPWSHERGRVDDYPSPWPLRRKGKKKRVREPAVQERKRRSDGSYWDDGLQQYFNWRERRGDVGCCGSMWLSRARWLGVVIRTLLFPFLNIEEKRPALREPESRGLEIWIFTRWRIGNCGADPGGAWQRLDVTGFKTQGNQCLLAEMKVKSRELEKKKEWRLPKCMDAVIADMQASPYSPYGGLQPLEGPLGGRPRDALA